LAWVEEGSALPALDLAGGAAIGGAVLALWAVAFAIRQFKNQLGES